MDYPKWKRTEDIVGSLIGLILLAPFFPIIALAIKLENYRLPVLMKHARVSEGRIIYLYKFNGMVLNAHLMKENLMHLNERKDGPFFKIRKDPRVTKVGRVLRKTRIDELPQLINVLKGEISLIGPRPHEPKETDAYPSEFRHIPKARAGATGLSQISGASSLPFLDELALDHRYLQNLSLKNDLKILVKSALILFFDRNAV